MNLSAMILWRYLKRLAHFEKYYEMIFTLKLKLSLLTFFFLCSCSRYALRKFSSFSFFLFCPASTQHPSTKKLPLGATSLCWSPNLRLCKGTFYVFARAFYVFARALYTIGRVFIIFQSSFLTQAYRFSAL